MNVDELPSYSLNSKENKIESFEIKGQVDLMSQLPKHFTELNLGQLDVSDFNLNQRQLECLKVVLAQEVYIKLAHYNCNCY